MARVGPVAARVELLDLAVCAGANVYRSELKRFPAETLPLEPRTNPPAPPLSSTNWKTRAAGSASRAVLALPLRYREPVILYYFHEMDLARQRRP